MEASRARRIVERVLIAIFIGASSLPLAGKLLPAEGSFALTENRRPAPFPQIRLNSPGWGWSIVSFPRRFDRYWNDSFAFRWYLIRAHSLAKIALGVSPSPKVLVGQSGYLFYAAEQSVDYYRGTKPFTEQDLARWRQDLEDRRAWLAERGIRYLVVVAPNKETIYPEFMPPGLRPVRAETRFDQLLQDLRAHSSIDIVDLRDALRHAKQDGRVYHKTDTHWNDAGALVAAREILARLKAWYPQINDDQAPGALTKRTASGGDLARVLALEDRFPEEYIDWAPATPTRAHKVDADGGASADVAVLECKDCSGPTVVMNHDSFNANLAPLLAEHFGRLVLVEGSKFVDPLILREKPAIVVQEFVERALMCPSLREC